MVGGGVRGEESLREERRMMRSRSLTVKTQARAAEYLFIFSVRDGSWQRRVPGTEINRDPATRPST
jgi:hypothetical protein